MSDSYATPRTVACHAPLSMEGKNIGVGCHFLLIEVLMGFPGGSDGKESACNAGD